MDASLAAAAHGNKRPAVWGTAGAEIFFFQVLIFFFSSHLIAT
jgi:hypothetical protein